jgi:hypothetical protein
MPSASQRGRNREAKIVDHLEALGWVAVRAASGPIDVLAIPFRYAQHPVYGDLVDPASLIGRVHAGQFGWSPLLIQVKSTSRPYERFGPHEREFLANAATEAGACAWLVHWPARAKTPLWIESRSWPPTK